MKVGFVGLGIMGKPMVTHIIKQNYETHIFDLNKEVIKELEKIGGGACESHKEVAEKSDVIITMLPSAEHVSQVLFDDGFSENCKQETIIIDMSSISPESSRKFANKLREFNLHYIDAPVSGGEPMAQEGKLSIMVGGDEEKYNQVLPLLQTMGEKIVYFGANGTGSAAKLANQIIVSINLAALSEASVFASKSGIDLKKLFEAINGGLAGSTIMNAKMPLIINRDFEPGGKIETNYKDLKNVQIAANDVNMPLPITNLVNGIFSAEIANENGEQDHSYIVNFFEKIANHQIPMGK